MVGEGNELDELLNKRELELAKTLALSVLKMANAKSDCGSGVSILVKILVRKRSNHLTKIHKLVHYLMKQLCNRQIDQ